MYLKLCRLYLTIALIFVTPFIADAQMADTLKLTEESPDFETLAKEIQANDEEILIPGRVFTKHWYLSDAFSANPVFFENNNQHYFDPYTINGDLSLVPFDEHQFNLNNHLMTLTKDSIKTIKPYTKLHYQIGSYQFTNIFIRFKQYLGKWTIDIHGQNSTGEDGHPLSKGDRAYVDGSLRYRDGADSYYELNYEVWRSTYRYYPYSSVLDSSIIRQPKENQLIDKWTIKRVWEGPQRDRFEIGGKIFWREGHWTPGSDPEQPFNYRIYSLYSSWQEGWGANLLSVDASLNYHEGFNRRSEVGIEETSAMLVGELSTVHNKDLKSRIKFIAGYLPKTPYGQGSIDFKYLDFSLNLGGGILPAFDKYGVYNRSVFNKYWLVFNYSHGFFNCFSIDAGLRTAQYTDIDFVDLGLNDSNFKSNTLRAGLRYKQGIFSLDADYRYKLEGLPEMPENSARIDASFFFRLISELFIEATGTIAYEGSYRQFEFDIENYLLVAGNTHIKDSWQLDLRIAAKIKDFEIYYEGIHLDAFMGNEADLARIRGFEHDLARYRIGISWILFN